MTAPPATRTTLRASPVAPPAVLPPPSRLDLRPSRLARTPTAQSVCPPAYAAFLASNPLTAASTGTAPFPSSTVSITSARLHVPPKILHSLMIFCSMRMRPPPASTRKSTPTASPHWPAGSKKPPPPKCWTPWPAWQRPSAPAPKRYYRKPPAPAPAPFASPPSRAANCTNTTSSPSRKILTPRPAPRLIAGVLQPAETIYQAQRFRTWFLAEALKLFKKFDILLAPATPCTAPLIGQKTMILGGKEMPVRPNLGLYTQPISFIGLPVVLRAGNLHRAAPRRPTHRRTGQRKPAAGRSSSFTTHRRRCSTRGGTPMIIDDPTTQKQVTAMFEAYETALMANDVAALDQFFWPSPLHFVSAPANRFSDLNKSPLSAPPAPAARRNACCNTPG